VSVTTPLEVFLKVAESDGEEGRPINALLSLLSSKLFGAEAETVEVVCAVVPSGFDVVHPEGVKPTPVVSKFCSRRVSARRAVVGRAKPRAAEQRRSHFEGGVVIFMGSWRIGWVGLGLQISPSGELGGRLVFWRLADKTKITMGFGRDARGLGHFLWSYNLQVASF
jgi:hypothetical protein